MEREWTLVLFTLLNQASVGLFAVDLLAGVNEDKARKNVLLVVGGLAVLSLLVSLGHLGSPWGAYRAIANVGSSWLSREILFASAYTGLWVIIAYLELKAGGGGAAKALRWIMLAAGILAVFSMASIYTHTVRPAWQTAYTYVSFFATSLVLGCLLYMALAPAPSWTVWAALAGVGVQLLALPPYLVSLMSGEPAAQASAQLLARSAVTLGLGVAAVMAAVGLALLGRFASRGQAGDQAGATASMLYLALAVGLLGEGILRYLFYSTGVNIMVGHF
ncbi:dimethyl sulfoxide reductase anchor subunit family protein [Thermanaeromonas sp. C210]|uniref:dimethyl sulfoxide reductase anchor subunit family protein n=1 Tax=Thermanaeromonas sp. C210 TaxID=2731925 RepID=UPI00155D55C0|nr:DmsC/YnfH family molybdoenzyme membrane anchor subunit [Thermanaeromonas sp. C210]GFN22941.1 dimethyl sulfoxide reductase subunit C [Thermanaeromonas sp. C210]